MWVQPASEPGVATAAAPTAFLRPTVSRALARPSLVG
jgi:hypothetical protein